MTRYSTWTRRILVSLCAKSRSNERILFGVENLDPCYSSLIVRIHVMRLIIRIHILRCEETGYLLFGDNKPEFGYMHCGQRIRIHVILSENPDTCYFVRESGYMLFCQTIRIHVILSENPDTCYFVRKSGYMLFCQKIRIHVVRLANTNTHWFSVCGIFE
jgi:hypothetical protein